jgi:hypothetical protein
MDSNFFLEFWKPSLFSVIALIDWLDNWFSFCFSSLCRQVNGVACSDLTLISSKKSFVTLLIRFISLFRLLNLFVPSYPKSHFESCIHFSSEVSRCTMICEKLSKSLFQESERTIIVSHDKMGRSTIFWTSKC